MTLYLVMSVFVVASRDLLWRCQARSGDHERLLIGVLDDHQPGKWPDLSRIIAQWNENHSVQISYERLVTTEQTTDVEMLHFVSRVSCSGAVAILSLFPCESTLIQTLSFSRIPAFAFDPKPVCFPSLSYTKDFVFLPPYWTISDVIASFIDSHHRRIVLIHDKTADPYLLSLMASLEQRFYQRSVISSVHVREDTWSLILDDLIQIDPEQMFVSHYTLYILWADVTIDTRILQQVRQNRLSGWYILVVSPNEQHLENITSYLSEIIVIDIAFLLINKPYEGNVDIQVQNIFEALVMVSQQTTGYDIFYHNSNTACVMRNKTYLTDIIVSFLPNASLSRTCEHYDIYTPTGDVDNPVLTSRNLCQNGDIRKDLNIYPRRGLSGKHLLVTTIESSPFVVKVGSGDSARFGGMAIEMLEELSKRLNFTYTLSRVPDDQFGGLKADGNWTGMVGQLQRKEVDMSVASLSVTEARKAVIDFVEYYFEYGAAIMKKPDEDENKWRVILQPFRWHVWVCLVFSVPFAGLTAWGISTFVYRLNNRSEDSFVNAKYSTWYAFGALLTQGGNFLPHSASARTFICSWWFFCIIVVATYGGSLIAYLTISKLDAPFDDLEGLVRQDTYKWGFKDGTVYYATFKNATGGIYRQLWEGAQKFAKDDPEILTRSSKKQMAKVKKGHYVLINDRTPLLVQVISDKSCELVLLSETFMPLPFGIGLQKHSPYKAPIYEGVKLLRQSGLLKHWEKKWWPKQSCSGIPMPESHKITLMDAQSAFYLLVVGITMAAVVLFAEKARKQAAKKHVDMESQNGHTTRVQ